MSEMATHQRGSICEILKATTFTRDALPYSEEFEQHFAEHMKEAGDRVTRQTCISKGPLHARRCCRGNTQGPRSVLNAVDRLATSFGTDIERVRQDRTIAEGQLRDYQARLGKPFTHNAYLLELTALRDQLKAGLSTSAHQAEEGEGPSASELAEQIKALKAANTIEATSQRDRHKHSTAEEPITARIRRRQGEHAVANQAVESDALAETGAAPPSQEQQDSPSKSPMTFQERIALERQQKSDGPSPG